MHHFNRPENSNNSLIRHQKSNKYIANGYKKLVHAFKREAVQFLVAKNLTVNHLPLEALPVVQTWTANCKRNRKAVVTLYFTVCGSQFPIRNLMLKASISDATTGFPAKWRLRNERRNSILTDVSLPRSGVVLLIGYFKFPTWTTNRAHRPDLGRHQYGISALVPQTSFPRETGGCVAKCRLFSSPLSIRNDLVQWSYAGSKSNKPSLLDVYPAM